MVRYGLIGFAAAILFAASLVPEDAFARRGGGGGFRGGGGFHGGGARAAHVRGGAVHAGRIHGGRGSRVAGGARPSHPIAGRPGYPGRPIAGRPGYGGGYYRPGLGYGAAAVGAAAATGAYGYYNNRCYYDTYGNYVCPGQYPY